MRFPIFSGFELFDFLFPLHEDGQGRRLHPPDGRQLKAAGFGVKGGHRPRSVDAHDPIGFGAANGGVGQRLEVFVRAKPLKSFLNGRAGHGLQPKPLHWFLAFCVLNDVAKNQFAFPSGVAGVD